MDLERARYLVSPEGQRALVSLPAELEELSANALADALRRSYPPAWASALAEQVTLRRRARERHGDSQMLLYTPIGLEMMTHPLVAGRRAARLAGAGVAVIDLTCSIGGDLQAIAGAAAVAAGVDVDPVATLLAAANVPAAHVVLGDALRAPVETGRVAVLLDPSRRTGMRRGRDPRAFNPPLAACLDIARAAVAGVVKAPPGIDAGDVPPDAEVEFVQVGRSLREAALWFGDGAKPGLRRAVLLPGGHELQSDEPEAPSETVAPGAFVFDPEGCVTRAGLVRQLAAKLGARLMDPHVAYVTADGPASHPMAATFEVLEVTAFSVARLRSLLRERGWRPDEIRRRAFPVEPDELRRLIGRLAGEPVTLLCTTLRGRRVVIVARRVRDPGSGA
ncbi:MAG: class I SAM-dependent methyltransferase [Dehalococcoidia bacterium]